MKKEQGLDKHTVLYGRSLAELHVMGRVFQYVNGTPTPSASDEEKILQEVAKVRAMLKDKKLN